MAVKNYVLVFLIIILRNEVENEKRVPCRNSMARLQFADEGNISSYGGCLRIY
jgi:heat shock protein HslJ